MEEEREGMITSLVNQNMKLKKQNKLLYQTLKEIEKCNNSLLCDSTYLRGFIDAKVSAIEPIMGEDNDCISKKRVMMRWKN
ncbi:hypothetical protein ACRXID_01975 [Ligilactobacillus animalis]|uniref:Uncharacterized protein n=1 Tax=Ligilactobacillus animalis TaxID=1605 RepID=A0ABR4RRJ6_9LACO|nr:hypothetical protein [Ligilactobacillus animalis]KDA46166.1 hypothetical protein Lani381_0850 [Ligilactobacillus animalis]MEE0261044.1 hypothetical protein [Ligilactobacillus animalis]PNQ52972.1 hypothetical protein C0L91_02230 [Ligilactobacillus animalis]